MSITRQKMSLIRLFVPFCRHVAAVAVPVGGMGKRKNKIPPRTTILAKKNQLSMRNFRIEVGNYFAHFNNLKMADQTMGLHNDTFNHLYTLV
jgi:hypothetical protein